MRPSQQFRGQTFNLQEFQKELLQKYSEIDLKLYQKNTQNKINFVSYFGKNYISSCQDFYKKIRIPIVTMFLKLLAGENFNSQHNIKAVKKIVYLAKLDTLTKDICLSKQQLIARFIMNLNSLLNDIDRLQTNFIRTINSEPFFDKIIMESFYETFNEDKQNSLTSNISKWFKNQLGISVIFTKNDIFHETQNKIYLIRNERNQILRQLKTFHNRSMKSITQQELQTPSKKTLKSIQSLNIQTQHVLKSISQIQSPSVKQKTGGSKNYLQLSSNPNINVFQNEQIEKQNTPIQSRESRRYNNRKLMGKKQSKSFWKVFCCQSD